MKWINKISQIRIAFIGTAIIIAVASLFISQTLTNELNRQEKLRMEVWAEAMRTLNNADTHADLSLVLKVLNENTTIPVVVTDNNNNVTDFRNININAKNINDSINYVKGIAKKLKAEHKFIRINLSKAGKDFICVCYDESVILKRLTIYPYIQLAVVILFLTIAIFALLASKKAEQNRIWAGLSKETAHQLGTPISALMAWMDILKENYPNDELLPEMNKDVERLQLIAERFSKIGSSPELKEESLNKLINQTVTYMDKRTSKHIEIKTFMPNYDVNVNICFQLFQWVIENLCKNAVDAMGGENGLITIKIDDYKKYIAIEISDTGKGIKKRDIYNVFRPGFTTKKRGWGLGLSLAKRIIEQYHNGNIYVKKSEIGKGTTFRIELYR